MYNQSSMCIACSAGVPLCSTGVCNTTNIHQIVSAVVIAGAPVASLAVIKVRENVIWKKNQKNQNQN